MEKQLKPVAEVLEHYGFTDALIRFTHFNMEQLPVGTVLYALNFTQGEK